MLIADAGNNRVKVVAESDGTFYGQAMTAGNIYKIAGTGTAGLSGNGGLGTHAQLNAPTAVAVDSAGNVVTAENGNSQVRQITG